MKRTKIDWANMKVTIIPADLSNPNPNNPTTHLTDEERFRQFIDHCAEIWAR